VVRNAPSIDPAFGTLMLLSLMCLRIRPMRGCMVSANFFSSAEKFFAPAHAPRESDIALCKLMVFIIDIQNHYVQK
jgi:hypothetical protein